MERNDKYCELKALKQIYYFKCDKVNVRDKSNLILRMNRIHGMSFSFMHA